MMLHNKHIWNNAIKNDLLPLPAPAWGTDRVEQEWGVLCHGLLPPHRELRLPLLQLLLHSASPLPLLHLLFLLGQLSFTSFSPEKYTDYFSLGKKSSLFIWLHFFFFFSLVFTPYTWGGIMTWEAKIDLEWNSGVCGGIQELVSEWNNLSKKEKKTQRKGTVIKLLISSDYLSGDENSFKQRCVCVTPNLHTKIPNLNPFPFPSAIGYDRDKVPLTPRPPIGFYLPFPWQTQSSAFSEFLQPQVPQQ